MNALQKEKTYNLIIHKTGNEEQAGKRQNEKWEQNRKMGDEVTVTKFGVFFNEFYVNLPMSRRGFEDFF